MTAQGHIQPLDGGRTRSMLACGRGRHGRSVAGWLWNLPRASTILQFCGRGVLAKIKLLLLLIAICTAISGCSNDGRDRISELTKSNLGRQLEEDFRDEYWVPWLGDGHKFIAYNLKEELHISDATCRELNLKFGFLDNTKGIIGYPYKHVDANKPMCYHESHEKYEDDEFEAIYVLEMSAYYLLVIY